MALKPEASIMTSLAVGAVVYGVYANATPPAADVRSLPPNNKDIQRSERMATWTSAGIVAGISLLAKDPTIFVIGGALTVAMAWWHRHADRVDAVSDAVRDTTTAALGDVGHTDSGTESNSTMARVVPMFGSSVI